MKLTAKDNALLSDAERKLLSSNGPWFVKDLIKLIQRVRALRDKSADLLRRQTLASARRDGNQRGRSGTANARTAAKGRIFERALRHFEQQLVDMNTQSAAAAQSLLAGIEQSVGKRRATAAKVAKKAGRTAAKKAAPAKAAAKATAKAKPAAKRARRG